MNKPLNEYFDDRVKALGPGWLRTIVGFSGSRNLGDQSYNDLARRTAKLLTENDFNFMYGGGRAGAMGAMAEGAVEGAKKSGAEVTGVSVNYLAERQGASFEGIEEIFFDTLDEREDTMISNAEAGLILTGGFGTMLETFKMLVRNDLSNINGGQKLIKPLVVLMDRQASDYLQGFFERLSGIGYITEDRMQFLHFVSTPEEALNKFVELNRRAPMTAYDLQTKHAEADSAQVYKAGSNDNDQPLVK